MIFEDFINKPSLVKIMFSIFQGNHNPTSVLKNTELSYASVYSGIKILSEMNLLKTYKGKQIKELYLSSKGNKILNYYIKIKYNL